MTLSVEKIAAFFFLLNLAGRCSADHVSVVRPRRQNWPIGADKAQDDGPLKARLLANLNRYSSAADGGPSAIAPLPSPTLGSGPDTLPALAGDDPFHSFQQNIDATSPSEHNNILQPLSLQQRHFDDDFWRERPIFQPFIGGGSNNHGSGVAVTPPNLFSSLFLPPTTSGGAVLPPTPLVHISPLVNPSPSPLPEFTYPPTFTAAPPPTTTTTAATLDPIFGQFFAAIVTTTIAPIFQRSATVTFPPTTTTLPPPPRFSAAQFSDEPQQRQIDEYEQALGDEPADRGLQGADDDKMNKGGNVDDGAASHSRLNFDPKNDFHQRPYPNNFRSDSNNYARNAFTGSEEGRSENFSPPTAPPSITLRPPTFPAPAAFPSTTGRTQGNEDPIYQIEGDGGGGGNTDDGGTKNDIGDAVQISIPARPTYVNHTAYFAGTSPLPSPPLLNGNSGGQYRMIVKGRANGRYYNNPLTVNGHQSPGVVADGNFNTKSGGAENRKSNRKPPANESPLKSESARARTQQPIPIQRISHAFSRLLGGSGGHGDDAAGDRAAAASEGAVAPQRVDVRRELESRLGGLFGKSTTPPSSSAADGAGVSRRNGDKSDSRKMKPAEYFDPTSNRILQPVSSGHFVADQREYSAPSKTSNGNEERFDNVKRDGGKYRNREQLSASPLAHFHFQPLAAPTFSRPSNPLFHLPPGLAGGVSNAAAPPLLLSEFAAPSATPPRSSTNSPEQYVRELENLDDDYMQNIVGEELPRVLDPSSLCGSVDVNCQQNNNNINYRRPQLLAFEGVESPRVRTSNGLNSIVPEEENTEMCNSHRLRTIIKEAVVAGDAEASKRAIQRRAETELSGSLGVFYNVICGTGFFSYIAHTDEFCLVAAGGLNCYAFSPVCGTRLGFAAGIARRRRADANDGGVNEGTTRSNTQALRRLAAINDVDARLRRKGKIASSSASDSATRSEKREALEARLQRYFAEKRRRRYLRKHF